MCPRREKAATKEVNIVTAIMMVGEI